MSERIAIMMPMGLKEMMKAGAAMEQTMYSIYTPMCARCQKPVDVVEQMWNDYDRTLSLRFKCHGQVEGLSIARTAIEQSKGDEILPKGFRAFAGPTKEEVEIAQLKARVEFAELNMDSQKVIAEMNMRTEIERMDFITKRMEAEGKALKSSKQKEKEAIVDGGLLAIDL